MERIKVLITAEIRIDEFMKYSDRFDFTFTGYGKTKRMLKHDELRELCKDKTVLISEFDTIDKEIIDNASFLRTIICCRGGAKNIIDTDYATSKGIEVRNVVGRNKESLAIHVLCLILDLLCNISITNQMIHSDRISELYGTMPAEYNDSLWGLDGDSPYQKYRAPSISETTIGIIGYGSCGKNLYEKLDMLGFRLLVYDHSPEKKGIPTQSNCSLDDLLKRSDIVTLHISGNKEKRPFMTKREFNMMKRSAYFINTSRGYLVDENDLYDVLIKHEIKGAAIDVMCEEPMSMDNKLLSCDNLIITPHICGSSQDTIKCNTDMSIQHLLQIFGE